MNEVSFKPKRRWTGENFQSQRTKTGGSFSSYGVGIKQCGPEYSLDSTYESDEEKKVLSRYKITKSIMLEESINFMLKGLASVSTYGTLGISLVSYFWGSSDDEDILSSTWSMLSKFFYMSAIVPICCCAYKLFQMKYTRKHFN